jgi:hypothetical protein
MVAGFLRRCGRTFQRRGRGSNSLFGGSPDSRFAAEHRRAVTAVGALLGVTRLNICSIRNVDHLSLR